MTFGSLMALAMGKILFVLLVVVVFYSPVLVVLERRQSAMIQDRIGPHRAGFTLFGKKFTFGGLLHPLADALKMMWKEDFVPANADKLLHALAPIIAMIPTIATFAVIPFGDVLYPDHLAEVIPEGGIPGALAVPLQIASVDIGILFCFAIAGTGIIGAAIAGYASDNKYSLLGGLRAASQMVSYEVALGLTLVPCFMMYGTLRFEEMVRFQSVHQWGVAYPPLTFAALLYFIAATAEGKRVPFDLPEGESEIVGGYFTEYSGMKFGMFFTGEFIEVVALACFAATIFFGGWDVPFLSASGWDLPGSFRAVLDVPTVSLFGHEFLGPIVVSDVILVEHWAVVATQIFAFFFLKVGLMIWFQLMIRWTVPRFRYDQVMKLCWKGLLPLAMLNVLFTAGFILLTTKP